MEGPGMSLFQGGGSIHINNSVQDRLEEQEELEDQKRRNAELKQELRNGFDDLDDEEASSVNSSGNFSIDAPHHNGLHNMEGPEVQHQRPELPTYMESLTHLKEVQHGTPHAYCETPKARHQIMGDEHLKHQYNAFGAGDGQNHYHQEMRGQHNGLNNVDIHQQLLNNEQLKIMYEMRVNECQKLASQLQELQAQGNKEIESLRERLKASLTDKDKAEHSLQQVHQLLALSKHQLVEREQAMNTLEQKMMKSEADKENLRLELQSCSLRLQDTEQQLHTFKVAHTHDTDALFRGQQEKHREEVDRLHNDLLKFKTRLEEKENEIKILERRCKEKDREKEQLLIEKSATVNRLASELDAAQSRLVNGEANKLKEKVAQLTADRNTAKEQAKEFGSKLEVTAHELMLLRNKLAATQKDYDNWRASLNQILAEALPESTYLGEPPSPGKLSTLKEVITRYKQQLQKLNSLQEELAKRDKKLEHHRKQEADLRSTLEEQKGIELQLTSKLAVLQNKLELLDSNSDSDLLETYKQQNEGLQREMQIIRSECKNWEMKYTELEMDFEKLKSEKGGRATLVQEANADLMKELEKYSAQLKDTIRENNELKTLYLQVCSTRDAVTRECKDVQTKFLKEKEHYKTQETAYVERLEKQKQNVDKLTAELSSCREELERANKRIAELQKEFTDNQKDFAAKLNKYLEDEKSAMCKELESCAQCEKNVKTIRNLKEQLSKCTMKMAAQESNEELIKELRTKAEFFEKYIIGRYQKFQDQRDVGTNTDSSQVETNRKTDNNVDDNGGNSSGEEEFTSKTNMLLKEKEIREQIAQKFTLEMKTIEMNCTKRVKEMENEHINAVTKLKQLVEKKAQEVETLKEFILTERAKVSQILTSKENEISELIKDHNVLQSDYQKLKDKAGEMKHKIEKYQDKLRLFEERHKSDRETSRRSIDEVEKEKQSLNNRLIQLESEYTTLKAKYKNAKKTAYMYKEYITKKDEHVNSELHRIQNEYKEIFVKLDSQLNYLVNCRIQQTSSSLDAKKKSMETQDNHDYSAVFNRLQNEISALAQSRYEDTPHWSVK